MTYIYAIFKHAVTILEGKGLEWLIIMGTIAKGSPEVTPEKILKNVQVITCNILQLLHKNN